MIYSNINILAFGNAPLLLRTQGDPSQYTATLRRTLHEAGASYIFVSSYTLDQMLSHDETWRRERLTATLFGIFAAAALALALVGLYSVVAYLVAQRTQEFGIRLALGATRGHILWLVLKSNVVVIVSGTAIGLILGVLVRHESERWLDGAPQNPALDARNRRSADSGGDRRLSLARPSRRHDSAQQDPPGRVKSRLNSVERCVAFRPKKMQGVTPQTPLPQTTAQ